VVFNGDRGLGRATTDSAHAHAEKMLLRGEKEKVAMLMTKKKKPTTTRGLRTW
jgi:hypothetical protein